MNVDPRNVHIPDGTITGDYEKYCASYERDIQLAGGIDLQLLGIGRNGHIGFNEPTSSFASRTRLKVLGKATVEDNRKFFGASETVPRCAITMGIGTILATKRVLMLADRCGESPRGGQRYRRSHHGVGYRFRAATAS